MPKQNQLREKIPFPIVVTVCGPMESYLYR